MQNEYGYKSYIKELLEKKSDLIYKTNKYKAATAAVNILEEEISNFDYEDTTNIVYLFQIFNVLPSLLKNNEQLQNNLYDTFTYIHNKIASILHAKPENLSKHGESRYKILKNLVNKMENTILQIYLNNPLEYDQNKMEFIYYIVFTQKYINFFSAACEKFPHIVNSTDQKGKPLVESVLDHYLEALRQYISKTTLGPIDDLIYYDKVLKVILSNEKINIDDYSKIKMLEKVKNFAKRQVFKSPRHKEKFSFFVNNVVNILTNTEVKETIDYLSYKYEVHDKFKEAHNLEAERIKKDNMDLPLSQERKIYTFDGEGAKEIDDGISLEYEDGIYHLGVHIANPEKYIPRESILIDEASRRTTSLYMGDECIPLYPLVLSGDVMSLNEGKNTYATSYYFDIDERTGELLKFDVKVETIRITKNLTYDYYDYVFDHGCDDQEFMEFIIRMTNLSEILKTIYNEDALYHEFHNERDKSLSRNVVASAMIYTNYHIAKLFNDRNLPFMYRCHVINESNIKELTQLQERLRNQTNTNNIIKDIELMKKLYPRAFCTRINQGHYGLGIDYYAHSTSPLRRYHDNVVNMCIDTFLINEYTEDDIKKMEEYIDTISEVINSRRSSLEDYEIQYMRLKYPNHKQ